MIKINGNDPANPTIETYFGDNDTQQITTAAQGFTKREAFAMHIYAGLLSSYGTSLPDAKGTAEWAVECADALIDALNKNTQ